ncbi:MAG TPA: hypothetical protein VGB24_23990 [Longimicrobium sp.]|jgi:hypothetical protein|uniref:hypothetical protein n=1 Tax=Longimicrobium sp. TaxID=2029185 RepID=UPI002ED79880
MRIRLVLLASLAACGGDEGATVAGNFAPGAGSPTSVWVVEAERSAGADTAGFSIADLVPGPASMRLMQGSDTAGVLNVGSLPSGSKLTLHGLRVDEASGLAFPRSIELDGADAVVVNGIRMAPEGRVPEHVDAGGAVLGWAPESGAMLLRPQNAALPDLRVIVGPTTELVGTDGGQAAASAINPGDSVQVQGRFENGYVLASRITIPSRVAATDLPGLAPSDEGADDEPENDGESTASSSPAASGGAAREATPTPAAAPRSSPVVRSEPPARAPARVRDAPPGRERNENRGRGRGNGGGNGKGKGNGKG